MTVLQLTPKAGRPRSSLQGRKVWGLQQAENHHAVPGTLVGGSELPSGVQPGHGRQDPSCPHPLQHRGPSIPEAECEEDGGQSRLPNLWHPPCPRP